MCMICVQYDIYNMPINTYTSVGHVYFINSTFEYLKMCELTLLRDTLHSLLF